MQLLRCIADIHKTSFLSVPQACHYHATKGLKKEPNDTGGPDLHTKVLELQIAIRKSELEKVHLPQDMFSLLVNK